MRRLTPSIALAAVLAVVASSTALAAGTAVAVSGADPYAGCTYGASSGTLYPDAEVEPSIAVHGKDVVAAWQQDRWSNGGAHGLASAYSTNGGSTFNQTTLPADLCAPGGLNFERASDPWVSIGPDGIVYASLLPFTLSGNHNGVASTVSYDGGATWKYTQLLVEYPAGDLQHSTDKNAVTADPNRRKTAYAVWDTLVGPDSANPDADLHAFAYNGDGYFSKTTDGGASWTAPQDIFPTGERTQTIGNHIVVAPDGTLYDFANWIIQPNTLNKEHDQLAYVKSTDGGATWTAPVAIMDMESLSPVTDPNTGAKVRTGDIIPESAVDPVTGTLYLAWQTGIFSGGKYDEEALIRSTDGGAHWSAPLKVSTSGQAFNGQIAAYGGTVGFTYYDFRNLASGNTTTLPTDFWARVSTDGGLNFGNDQHLYGSFDMLTAPYARGYFVGDYTGLAWNGAGFTAAFGAANSGNLANRTDIFVVAF